MSEPTPEAVTDRLLQEWADIKVGGEYESAEELVGALAKFQAELLGMVSCIISDERDPNYVRHNIREHIAERVLAVREKQQKKDEARAELATREILRGLGQ